MGEAIGGLLPSAIAVALSPIPIVGVVLVLGTPRARASGAAFAVGWVLGLAALSTIVVLALGSGVDPDTESGIEWLKVAVGIVFLLMAAQQWRKRPRYGEIAEMPKWMDSMASITAPRAAALGPAFRGRTRRTVAGSVLLYFLSPSRAAQPLSAVGQFMSENSAVIMTVVALAGSETARRWPGWDRLVVNSPR